MKERMNDFNLVENPNRSGKVIDTITLTRNSYLSFPTFFVDKNELRGKDKLYIRLFYNNTSGYLGIQFNKEPSLGSYLVNRQKNYGLTSKVISFIKNNDIKIEKNFKKYEYKRYKAEEIGLTGSDIFMIKLERINEIFS